MIADGKESIEGSYENFLKTSGYSPVTIHLYIIYYNLFAKWKEDISQEEVDKFCRLHNNVVARAFLKSCLHDWSGLYNLRIKRRRGREKKRLVQWITKKDYLNLIKDEEIRPELVVLIRILFDTGLRIVEVVGDSFHKALTPSQIDFETNEIRGIGKFNKEYIVYLRPNTAIAIQKMIEHHEIKPNEPLFSFQTRYAQIMIKKEGLRILGKNIHAHMFRHGLATYLLQKGLSMPEIQLIMRHESLKTLGRYTHINREDAKNNLKEMAGY